MSQRDAVLQLLVDAKAKGVSAYELVYVHGITRGAAVVFDLREEGYVIDTLDEGETANGKQRLARYVLRGFIDPHHPSAPMEPVAAPRKIVPPPEPEPYVEPVPVERAMAEWQALGERLRGGRVETPEQREERVRRLLGGGR